MTENFERCIKNRKFTNLIAMYSSEPKPQSRKFSGGKYICVQNANERTKKYT